MLRTRLTQPFGLDHPFVSAGMGFLALPDRRRFHLDTSPTFGPFTVDAHIDLCVEEHVPLVVFHWHLPPVAWVERLHAAGAKAWIQVGSVQEARAAIRTGADALIAQGNEAGGHCRASAALFALLPVVIDAVTPTPVLAAGGIADGRGAAAALLLGADGVVVGTRLIASREAQEMKDLANRVVREWAGRSAGTPPSANPPRIVGRMNFAGMDYPIPEFSAMLPTQDTTGDLDQMCLAAGESAALLRDVKPGGRDRARDDGGGGSHLAQSRARVARRLTIAEPGRGTDLAGSVAALCAIVPFPKGVQ